MSQGKRREIAISKTKQLLYCDLLSIKLIFPSQVCFPVTDTGQASLPALICPLKPLIWFSLPAQLRRAVTEQLWAPVSHQGQPSTQPQPFWDSAKTEHCLLLRLLTEFVLCAASTYSLFYSSINQLSKYSTRQEISIPLILL